MTASGTDLRGVHILVVDDNEDARDLFAAAFRQCGALVTVAPSALRALQLLRTLQVDILVSDLHMPQGSGLDLLRAVRQFGSRTMIPAIAVTADASLEKAALDVGFVRFVTKPVDPWEVCHLIGSVLGRKAA